MSNTSYFRIDTDNSTNDTLYIDSPAGTIILTHHPDNTITICGYSLLVSDKPAVTITIPTVVISTPITN